MKEETFVPLQTQEAASQVPTKEVMMLAVHPLELSLMVKTLQFTVVSVSLTDCGTWACFREDCSIR